MKAIRLLVAAGMTLMLLAACGTGDDGEEFNKQQTINDY